MVQVAEKGSVHIEFYEMDSKDSAATLFNGNKQRVECYKSGSNTATSVSMGSYQKYNLTTSEIYYMVIQLDQTFIYAQSDQADKRVLYYFIVYFICIRRVDKVFKRQNLLCCDMSYWNTRFPETIS